MQMEKLLPDIQSSKNRNGEHSLSTYLFCAWPWAMCCACVNSINPTQLSELGLFQLG